MCGGFSVKKEFVVIGLGRFGGSIVKELIDQGADVMAIDILTERVDEFASIATQAVVADTTDEAVLSLLVFEILNMLLLQLVTIFNQVY